MENVVSNVGIKDLENFKSFIKMKSSSFVDMNATGRIGLFAYVNWSVNAIKELCYWHKFLSDNGEIKVGDYYYKASTLKDGRLMIEKCTLTGSLDEFDEVVEQQLLLAKQQLDKQREYKEKAYSSENVGF